MNLVRAGAAAGAAGSRKGVGGSRPTPAIRTLDSRSPGDRERAPARITPAGPDPHTREPREAKDARERSGAPASAYVEDRAGNAAVARAEPASPEIAGTGRKARKPAG